MDIDESSSKSLHSIRQDVTFSGDEKTYFSFIWTRDNLLQKSSVMMRSGIRYRLPLMVTSSVAILAAAGVSDWIISTLPLFFWFGRVISIGVLCCFGIRRFGGCTNISLAGKKGKLITHQYLISVGRTHPLLPERRDRRHRRVHAIKMPMEVAVVA